MWRVQGLNGWSIKSFRGFIKTSDRNDRTHNCDGEPLNRGQIEQGLLDEEDRDVYTGTRHKVARSYLLEISYRVRLCKLDNRA